MHAVSCFKKVNFKLKIDDVECVPERVEAPLPSRSTDLVWFFFFFGGGGGVIFFKGTIASY